MSWQWSRLSQGDESPLAPDSSSFEASPTRTQDLIAPEQAQKASSKKPHIKEEAGVGERPIISSTVPGEIKAPALVVDDGKSGILGFTIGSTLSKEMVQFFLT